MNTQRKSKNKNSSEAREYHTPTSGLFFKIKNTLYRQESPYQRIEVIENEYFGKILLLDDLVQTTEKDEFYYHEMLVHPACVSHPSPDSVLIIGGGDGGVLKEVLRYPLKHACLVEIDPQVVEASKKYFPWLSPSLKDKRTELIIADGRQYIESSDRSFDIVCVDSSDPVGPSASLHEEDFYKNLKKCLKPGGIITTQVGSPFFNGKGIKKKNYFLRRNFKIVRFYVSPVPTYPGGSWGYVFLSDEVQPLDVKRDPPAGLDYFNLDIHQAAFVLPEYLRNELK